MTVRTGTVPAQYTPDFSERLRSFVTLAAAQSDVKAAVEANHDDNRWWPVYVRDWRVRMAVAGWSARVSYAMINTYAEVVARADALGWDGLKTLTDKSLNGLVHPLGLTAARVRYLRSLAAFIYQSQASGFDLATAHPDELITHVAAGVHGAGYNTAQCAVLYARGYHCGIIPVDSGMVSRLAPCLGITLASNTTAYEQLRRLLQSSATTHSDAYRDIASRLGYTIRIPASVETTWFVHLVLIYLKRLYLNRPTQRLCPRRPTCPTLFDCGCQPAK